MPQLQIAQIVANTCAEGPGRRMAIWFQGCPLRCPGCCNPEMLRFEGGQTYALDDLVAQLASAQRNHQIEGLSLLGGEPFAHLEGALGLAQAARAAELTVMIFSGYTLQELRKRPEPEVENILRLTDILVDGPYVREQPDTVRRWIGSTNQRIHFLSERYRPDDLCWRQPNTLELRLGPEGLTVNGFPSPATKGFWRK